MGRFIVALRRGRVEGVRIARMSGRESEKERVLKGICRSVTSRGTRASRWRRRPGRRRPRADGADPRAPGPRFAPHLPLRHPRADRRR